MARAIVLMLMAAVVAGCSGDAKVVVKNNTDRYVTGDIDGKSYGVPSGSETTRTVDVGGFLKTSSDIDLTAHVHQSWESSSGIVSSLQQTVEMKNGEEWTWDVYMTHAYGAAFDTLRNQGSTVPF